MAEEGLEVLGWREVPIDPSTLGATTLRVLPTFRQVFIADPAGAQGIELDRKLFCARKRAEHEVAASGTDGDRAVYFPSLSCRTIVYKGMLTTPQLGEFFPDLNDERVASALALVHSRFSTNTFPSWPLAHPYRYLAHNGEINTVQGNRNWMRAREALLSSDLLPGDLERIFPICTPQASDTASFDEVLELLHLGGRSLPHAVLMMIPEAWEHHEAMDPKKRAFYQFHAALMEPWDGPASIAFTDGTVIGAVLDRNGLRPSRYWVTDDDLVIMASEAGVVDVDPAKVVRKGRLQPGKHVPGRHRPGPHRRRRGDQGDPGRRAPLRGVAPRRRGAPRGPARARARRPTATSRCCAASRCSATPTRSCKIILAPMAKQGYEPIGSMGTDTPIAVLSERPRLLFDYFSQLFAQVTNPPLDAIREELVTALGSTIGPEGNLLAPSPASCRQVAAAVPDHRQRRAGQDRRHQRRRRPARLLGRRR